MDTKQILYVDNLAFRARSDDIYSLFGQYGPIYQVRLGNVRETLGSAFVVYEYAKDADNAKQNLDGYEYFGKPLKVELFDQTASESAMTTAKRVKVESSDC